MSYIPIYGTRSLYDGGEAPPSLLAGGQNQGGGGGGSETPAPPQLPQGAIWGDARFVEALPADLKADPIIGKYAKGGFESFARTFVSAQKMIGKDINAMVELPAQPDLAFVTNLAGRLGLPKEVKDYKLEAVKDGPAWTAPTTPFAQAMVTSAHKHGILPAQFQGFFNDVVPLLAQAEGQVNKAKADKAKEGIDAISNEWGPAKDARLRVANLAVEKLTRDGISDTAAADAAEDAFRGALIEAGLDNNPAVLKFLAKVGDLLGEEDNGGGGGGGGGDFRQMLPPAEAKAKGQEFLSQALNAKTPVERRKLNAEAQKWFAMANGGAKVKA